VLDSRVSALGRALLLLAVVVCAYVPSFGAGFSNFDDPWLIVTNPFYAPGSGRDLSAIFFDFSERTRHELGAEYLPVRDLWGLLSTRLFGISAAPLHALSVALYGAAVLLLRGALLRTFGALLAVELSSLLFALHPVHVESVAWLAGQKDVLALLFVCAALYVHAGEARHARLTVPLLVLCAALSKSMSVAVITLMVAQDIAKRRRPDFVLYAGTCLVIACALALHVYVGRVMGMLTEPAGGSRYTALITMGPVWLRYLAIAFVPLQTSIAHDVPDRLSWDLYALAGYGVVALLLALAVYAHRRGSRIALYAFIAFFAPLLPVSQVLAPLQNRMTDRYLWLSVLAPALLYGCALAWLIEHARARVYRSLAQAAAGLLVLAAFVLTFQRALVFSDDVLLFTDGTVKSEHNTDAPFQLAQALETRGRVDDAIVAYRELLRRAPTGPNADGRRAENALARIMAKRGRVREAEQYARAALRRFPDDPVARKNLARILRSRGQDAEASALEQGLP
jgi:hypothetical protein